MAGSIYYSVISTPGAIGQQTYNLPSGFNPKIVLLSAAYNTQEEEIRGHAIMSLGMGTYDGGSVQQWYHTIFEEDNAATTAAARGMNDTAILKGMSDSTGTIDYSISLISLGTGAGSNVVLDWTDLPASAIKIHMMVLGGSNIEKAVAGTFGYTALAATQDIALPASWGRPNFIFFSGANGGGGAALGDFGATNGFFGFGAAKSATDRIHSAASIRHGNANSDIKVRVQSRAIYSWNAVAQDGTIADLDDVANWPTDGFRLAYVTQAPTNARYMHGYVAVKLTNSSLWSISRSTSGGTSSPGIAEFSGPGNPKGAVLFGTNQPSSGSDLDAENGSWYVGFNDGWREGMCGVVFDDAADPTSNGRVHSETKMIRQHVPGDPPTVASTADVILDRTGLKAIYSIPDTRSREFGTIIFGEPVTASPITPNTGHLSRPGNIALGVVEALEESGIIISKTGLGIIGP